MSQIKSISLRLLAVLLVALSMSAAGPAVASPAAVTDQLDFGPNVIIFDPSMPTSEIQAAVDGIYHPAG